MHLNFVAAPALGDVAINKDAITRKEVRNWAKFSVDWLNQNIIIVNSLLEHKRHGVKHFELYSNFIFCVGVTLQFMYILHLQNCITKVWSFSQEVKTTSMTDFSDTATHSL